MIFHVFKSLSSETVLELPEIVLHITSLLGNEPLGASREGSIRLREKRSNILPFVRQLSELNFQN